MRINKQLYICIAAALIGTVLAACTELVFLSANNLKLESSDHVFFTVTTIIIAVLSLVTLGLTGFLLKTIPKKSIDENHTLLKQFNGKDYSARHSGNSDAELAVAFEAVAFEGMMNELYGLLQPIQIKVNAIDGNVDALTNGICQVAADQANLFSLNAEIETVRAQGDGFSIVTSEILSLAKHTGRLTNDIRDMANQLRTRVAEVAAELEHVVGRVNPD
ncbi:MAG: methyl-accepting chemotaxis protein [Azoarcus sp.]|jgi:hypothetical protein|nr:methyl-accepting chemotaxis protein [Azoarcus sp.]